MLICRENKAQITFLTANSVNPGSYGLTPVKWHSALSPDFGGGDRWSGKLVSSVTGQQRGNATRRQVLATMDHAHIRGLVTGISSVRRGAAYALVSGIIASDAHVARSRIPLIGPAHRVAPVLLGIIVSVLGVGSPRWFQGLVFV